MAKVRQSADFKTARGRRQARRLQPGENPEGFELDDGSKPEKFNQIDGLENETDCNPEQDFRQVRQLHKFDLADLADLKETPGLRGGQADRGTNATRPGPMRGF